MLEIEIPGEEWWDERTEMFCYTKPVKLRLEHSLVSLSKWESKWKVPFYAEDKPKTQQMMTDYVRCMTVTQGVDPAVYKRLSRENLNTIYTYMNDPMTATWFAGEPKPGEKIQNGTKRRGRRMPPKKVMTAEVLYSRMFALNIPMECEKWHLNRLMTLIRVCAEAQNPPRKMSRKEVMNWQRALNEKRKAEQRCRK